MQGTLVDTNVWVAAFFEEHEFFSSAISFITSCTAGEPALFCRATEQSWLRLITTPLLHKLYKSQNPTNDETTAILANWQTKPHIRCLDAEPEGTRELWLKLAAIPSASPKVWMDAYLAAFAIHHNAQFVTLDSGFLNFEKHGLNLRLLTP